MLIRVVCPTASRNASTCSIRSRERGLTLLELMIVATIVVVIAAIGVPQYRMALQNARTVKAKQELQTISLAIDSFLATEHRLPLTLYEVDYGGKLDPWGNGYCFLNYESGSGDGLEWALEAGLVDPVALASNDSSSEVSESPPEAIGPAPAAETNVSSGNGNGNSNGNGNGNGNNGRNTHNSSDRGVGSLIAEASRTMSGSEIAALARALEHGVRTTIYTGVEVDTTRRRDKYLYPLNTDYDLFSLGPNRTSAVALNDELSLDDVIRANNGGYFGVAARY